MNFNRHNTDMLARLLYLKFILVHCLVFIRTDDIEHPSNTCYAFLGHGASIIFPSASRPLQQPNGNLFIQIQFASLYISALG